MTKRPTMTTVTGRFVGGGVFKPRTNEQSPDRPRYNACVVLDDGQDKEVETVVKKAIEDRWGNKPPAGLQTWGVREGDDPEYESSYERKFINPKSTRPPGTLVKDGTIHKETTQDDGLIYPGCFVAVSIEAYGYEGDKKKGIKPGVSLNLRAVLFQKNGDRLDDYLDAEAEFSGVETQSANDDEDDFLNAAA